jgi:hypothetical protein
MAQGLFIRPHIQEKIVNYLQAVLSAHKGMVEIRNKMEVIDRAYARFKKAENLGNTDGVDTGSDCGCGDVLSRDNIVAPIVVSQVDSLVAYLADTYLSGYPMFPVVSTPSNKKWAEQLETLIDDHSIIGGYQRQLLLFFRAGIKYNIAAIEVDWGQMTQFSVAQDYRPNQPQKVNRGKKSYNKLRALDMYNTIWDQNVAPGDVSLQGDYAGFIEVLSRTKLKRLINDLSEQGFVLNAQKALDPHLAIGVADNYYVHPQVSDYVTAERPQNKVNWTEYITGQKDPQKTVSGDYEVVTLYARIIPSDFGLKVPQENTPQIWKFRLLNGHILIEARRIVTAMDALPILFGQPLEDGLGYQTQSVAESDIPIQEAVTTLYSVRFNAARRAVSDRALYDAAAINQDDVNSPTPAPKIPVKVNPLNQKGLDAYYKSIPFDMRGTETTIQDASQLVEFSKMLNGLNNARQGQFQKGNKSVVEWNDVMGSADNRLRLPALLLEYQVFIPMKAMMLLNIFQFGEDTLVVSQRTGSAFEIKIDELRRHVLTFRVADGFTPKSKMAATDMLIQGMQLIMNSPQLQQQYGAFLPAMFAHMMALGGVRGLDEYDPRNQEAPPPSGLQPQLLSQGAVDPTASQEQIPPTAGDPGQNAASVNLSGEY